MVNGDDRGNTLAHGLSLLLDDCRSQQFEVFFHPFKAHQLIEFGENITDVDLLGRLLPDNILVGKHLAFRLSGFTVHILEPLVPPLHCSEEEIAHVTSVAEQVGPAVVHLFHRDMKFLGGIVSKAEEEVVVKNIQIVADAAKFSEDELKQQARFKAAHSAASTRASSPSTRAADMAAFKAQSKYLTLQSYIWHQEWADYQPEEDPEVEG